MKRLLKYTAILLFFACGFLFYTGCANPAAPTGGPKDTLPPRVLGMTPDNYCTNFKGGKVIIYFDEYIQLKDVQKEVIISPPLQRRPQMTVKGRTVQISFDKVELDSATTYKIDFGKAIVDNNEGNVLYGFSYVFSTGDYIDSLVMSGQVTDAFLCDSLFNVTMMFYDAKADSMSYDSTLFIGKPLSTARTDSMGVFLATNLKAMDYKVYAIVDDNGNGQYEPGVDKTAFSDSVYNPATMQPFKVWWNRKRMRIEAMPQFNMKAFGEINKRRQTATKISRPEPNRISIEFAAREPESMRVVVNGVDSSAFIFNTTYYRDTVDLWIDTLVERNMPDTLEGYVEFMTVDTLGNDTLGSRKFKLPPLRVPRKEPKKDEIKKNPFKVNVKATNPLSPYSSIDMLFSVPLRKVTLDSISLLGEEKELVKDGPRGDRRLEKAEEQQKEAEFKPAKFTFERDSVNILLWHLKSEWRPGMRYRLEMLPGTFNNIYGESNDTLKSDFSIMNPEDYATIVLKTVGDSLTNYIIQLTDQKGNMKYEKKFLKGGASVTFDYVASSQDYRIRIIEDANGNGVWDSGDLVNRRQPERVVFFKDDAGNGLMSTKANWSNELTLDMPHLFDGAATSVTNTLVKPGEATETEKELSLSDEDDPEPTGKPIEKPTEQPTDNGGETAAAAETAQTTDKETTETNTVTQTEQRQ